MRQAPAAAMASLADRAGTVGEDSVPGTEAAERAPQNRPVYLSHLQAPRRTIMRDSPRYSRYRYGSRLSTW